MKIIKYVKSGKNKYRVYFDNGKNLVLYEDVILKFELLLKGEVKDLSSVISYNNKYELYDKVLGYISKKLRCEKEITKYLDRFDIDNDTKEEIINKLKLNGLLNNNLYIKSFIHDKVALSLDGPLKIKHELLRLGFKEEEIDVFNKELIRERIKKYINKQLKSNNKSLYIFKNKIVLSLVNLGYKREDIYSELDNISIDDSSLKEKEEKKLREKYQTKYQGYELEMMIKKKMYEKGFRD